MTIVRQARPVPPLALRPEEAARALGVSRSFFFAEILPELRVVRRGRLRPSVSVSSVRFHARGGPLSIGGARALSTKR